MALASLCSSTTCLILVPFLGGLPQHALPRLDIAIVELEGGKLTDVWVHAVLCVQHLQGDLHDS